MAFTIDHDAARAELASDLKLCALDAFRVHGRAPTADELRAYGFSPQQVEAHGAAAIAAAKQTVEREPVP